MIALVRGVMAAAIAAASMLNVDRIDVDEHRARAEPRRWRRPSRRTNRSAVMTSSPAPMPSAISASSSASVPDDTATACSTPMQRGDLVLERRDLRPHDVALAVADAGDGREDLVSQRRDIAPEDRAAAPVSRYAAIRS